MRSTLNRLVSSKLIVGVDFVPPSKNVILLNCCWIKIALKSAYFYLCANLEYSNL